MAAKAVQQRNARKPLTTCLVAGSLACVGWSVRSLLHRDTPSLALVDHPKADALFSWLGWGPQPGSALHGSLNDNYPGALPDIVVVERVKEALEGFGLSRANTIYSESICADEICHDPHQLTDLLTDHWSNVFTMGGIGGFAHGGPVALGAFKGHIPDGGNMFILYGPHVGISEDGKVGVTLRLGQNKDTTACGALMAVYNNCLKGATIDAYSPADLQARLIHQELCPRVDEISKAANPEAMLPRVAYDVVHKQIEGMTKDLDLGTGSLVLLGGIMINTPLSMQDYFLPIHFSIRRGKSKQAASLLEAFDVAGTMVL
eukprot:TRINITY_DN371_c0_g1_i3.p1 TRINITY_DN371_c0_g1~~TRINITY_DN371_c0_g1_i3.p1  ORF type:complete len:317 (-),score=76.83 TRINITY_DN371_c0_g1_i3:243-1193(-)